MIARYEDVKRPALSVLVVQMGARRDYELARMLESQGALAALHTSTAWREGEAPSKAFQYLSGKTNGTVKRRTVRGIPAHKVRASLLPEPVGMIVERLGMGKEARYRIEDRVMGFLVRKAGLANATVVLNTNGNGGTRFLNWAQQGGARIATDIVITPRFYDILLEERCRWPGWESDEGIDANATCYRRHMEEVVAVSDLLLSPSATVDDGLATVRGFDPGKLVRVPYSLGATASYRGTPVPRRILFAGHAGLRKGLPYLAEAARILAPMGYAFRVAGTAQKSIKERPECEALSFLGHLGPEQMEAEFRSADVFCLPSLAEGMARVILEALSNGLPCVVTRSAGAPVQNDVDGIIVPERDGPAIADAIRAISENRLTRARMSEAAIGTASVHSIDEVGSRLYTVLAASEHE